MLFTFNSQLLWQTLLLTSYLPLLTICKPATLAKVKPFTRRQAIPNNEEVVTAVQLEDALKDVTTNVKYPPLDESLTLSISTDRTNQSGSGNTLPSGIFTSFPIEQSTLLNILSTASQQAGWAALNSGTNGTTSFFQWNSTSWSFTFICGSPPSSSSSTSSSSSSTSSASQSLTWHTINAITAYLYQSVQSAANASSSSSSSSTSSGSISGDASLAFTPLGIVTLNSEPVAYITILPGADFPQLGTTRRDPGSAWSATGPDADASIEVLVATTGGNAVLQQPASQPLEFITQLSTAANGAASNSTTTSDSKNEITTQLGTATWALTFGLWQNNASQPVQGPLQRLKYAALGAAQNGVLRGFRNVAKRPDFSSGKDTVVLTDWYYASYVAARLSFRIGGSGAEGPVGVVGKNGEAVTELSKALFEALGRLEDDLVTGYAITGKVVVRSEGTDSEVGEWDLALFPVLKDEISKDLGTSLGGGAYDLSINENPDGAVSGKDVSVPLNGGGQSP